MNAEALIRKIKRAADIKEQKKKTKGKPVIDQSDLSSDEEGSEVYDNALLKGQKRFGNVIYHTEPAVHISKRETILLDNDKMVSEINKRIRKTSKETKEIVKKQVYSKQCVGLYERYPWIEDHDHTFIAFPNNKVIAKYVTDTVPVDTYEDMDLYIPNTLFTLLNCNSNKHKRKQEKDVLYMYDDKNKRHGFIVVHVTTRGKYIIQDEEIFFNELKWIKASKSKTYSQINLLLETDADDNSKARQVCLKYISIYLNLEMNDDYLIRIEKGIYDASASLTLKDYFYIASSLLIFLDQSLLKPYASVFNKRISGKVYVPENIVKLPLEEKFPEAFMNIHVSQESVDFIKQTIQRILIDNVYRLGSDLLKSENDTMRVRTYNVVPTAVALPVLPQLDECSPGLDVWETIRYKDMYGHEHCFPIHQLINRIYDNNFVIPGTESEEFTSDFVEKIKNVYINQEVRIPIVEQEEGGVKNSGKYDIQAIFAAIETEISDLESRIRDLSETYKDKVCNYCKKYIQKNGISSIDKNSDVVSFCNTTCMSSNEL
jgi:hypothetical protein